MSHDFNYASEKFAAARRLLMLPPANEESHRIAGAFHECTIGLRNIDTTRLDENARSWISKLQKLMDTSGITTPDQRGTFHKKAEQLSPDEKHSLCDLINELCDWFDRASE